MTLSALKHHIITHSALGHIKEDTKDLLLDDVRAIEGPVSEPQPRQTWLERMRQRHMRRPER